MAVDVIIASVMSGGAGGALGIFANGLVGRKKMSADAAEIMQKAASGLIQDLQDDNKALREDNRDLMAEVKELHDKTGVEVRELSRKVDHMAEEMQAKDGRIDELDQEVKEWRVFTLGLLDRIEGKHPDLVMPAITPKIAPYIKHPYYPSAHAGE